MLDPRFRHYLKLSTVAHFAVILLLILAPLVVSWDLRRKNREIMMEIEFTVALPEPEAPSPVQKEIREEPKPPEPDKADIPEPAPEKKAKPEVKVSKKLIKRPPAPKPKGPTLSAEEIKKLLAAGAKISDHTSVPDNYWEIGYYNQVRERMYNAWTPPPTLSGRSGVSTEVTIRVLRDGTIGRRTMTRSSGNRDMDDSVMLAVNAVTVLKPLPPQFPGPYKDIPIEFVPADR
jgi:colicin import membrane protein